MRILYFLIKLKQSYTSFHYQPQVKARLNESRQEARGKGQEANTRGKRQCGCRQLIQLTISRCPLPIARCPLPIASLPLASFSKPGNISGT